MNKAPTIKQALVASALWISSALLFNVAVWIYLGAESGLNFFTGYLIEKALSIDNLFVFYLIFDSFQTPKQYQHKVLFWGVFGAIALRALMIFCGIALVNRFHWILYLFGIFLLYAAFQMVYGTAKQMRLENNLCLKIVKKIFPVDPHYAGSQFFVKKGLRWYATPLFLTLILVETTDLIFAIDSIPAIMAITLDPFIIYTSNIFAILGLRSLYFALAGMIPLFRYLKYGLAAILAFIGIKMLLAPYIAIPISATIGFIAVAIATCIALSCTIKKFP